MVLPPFFVPPFVRLRVLGDIMRAAIRSGASATIFLCKGANHVFCGVDGLSFTNQRLSSNEMVRLGLLGCCGIR